MDTLVFYHTVLYFLTSYMKFENNFVRFNKDKKNGDGDDGEENDSFSENEESVMNLIGGTSSSIQFEEEDLTEMSSQSYLVQDSDQYIMMLLKVMKNNNPSDLPE